MPAAKIESRDERLTVANEVLMLALCRLPPNSAASVYALALGRLCERERLPLDVYLGLARTSFDVSAAGDTGLGELLLALP